MRTELPVCKRCCFCLPLRYGLIVWGYVKLITSSLALAMVYFLILEMIRLARYLDENERLPIISIIIISLAGIVALADLGLTIMYIVGCHKKNVKLLRVYYFYSAFLVALSIVYTVYYVGLSIYYVAMFSEHTRMLRIITYETLDAMVQFANVILQIYILLLVRSEIIKLDNASQFRFVNHANDAQCSLEINNEDEPEPEPEKKVKGVDNDDEIRIYV